MTRFDRARQDSLGVPVRPVPEILKEPSRASNESNDGAIDVVSSDRRRERKDIASPALSAVGFFVVLQNLELVLLVLPGLLVFTAGTTPVATVSWIITPVLRIR